MTPEQPPKPVSQEPEKDEKKSGGGVLPGAAKDENVVLSAGRSEKKAGGGLLSGAGKEMPSFLKSAGQTGGSPLLRVRGGMGGGTSILERLKSLRKKDLAFIGAGLSVLVMAPLAEHFMMAPEDQGGAMKSGFSAPSSFPGDVGSIYDPGTGSFSPGGLLGQGSDVITPLNVRDPSALIMGPGATQKPAAAATVDSSASAAKPADNTAWKDALAAAQKGASAATRKASLPMPHPKLAAGMRGLGAVGGGGGGSYSLPGLSASNVPNRAGGGGNLTRAQAAPGYRGVAPRSTSAGGNEGMKAAAGRQGDIMNKGGSAAGALDQAAKEAIPGGHNDVGGRPGGGDEFKSPGHADPKGNKSLGESLAFLKAKMEQEKQLELKWKKKMWNEFERQKMMEETVIKSALENILGKGLFEPMGKAMGELFGSLTGNAPKGVYCADQEGKVFALTNQGANAWSCTTKTVNGTPVKFAIQTGKDGQAGGERQCDKACYPFGGPADAVEKVAGRGEAEKVPVSQDRAGNGALGAQRAAEQTSGAFQKKIPGLSEQAKILGLAAGQFKGDDFSNKISKILTDSQGAVTKAQEVMEAAYSSNNAMLEKVRGYNTELGVVRKAHSGYLKTEKTVLSKAGEALNGYKTDAPPDFGEKTVQPSFDEMGRQAQTVTNKQPPFLEKPLTVITGAIPNDKQNLKQAGEMLNTGMRGPLDSLSGALNAIATAGTSANSKADPAEAKRLIETARSAVVANHEAAKVALGETNTALDKTREAAAKMGETDAALLMGPKPEKAGQKLTGTTGEIPERVTGVNGLVLGTGVAVGGAKAVPSVRSVYNEWNTNQVIKNANPDYTKYQPYVEAKAAADKALADAKETKAAADKAFVEIRAVYMAGKTALGEATNSELRAQGQTTQDEE